MPEFEFNYEHDTAIDPENLFEEWVSFSSVFFHYKKALITIDKEVKHVWEVKKTIRARLVAEAKAQGAKNDADREAYFRPHPEYIKAVNDLIDIEHEKDLIQAAIDSMYRKEKGMEGALSMAKMEWWRGPKEMLDVPGGKRVMETIKDRKANERRSATAGTNSSKRTRKRT